MRENRKIYIYIYRIIYIYIYVYCRKTRKAFWTLSDDFCTFAKDMGMASTEITENLVRAEVRRQLAERRGVCQVTSE